VGSVERGERNIGITPLGQLGELPLGLSLAGSSLRLFSSVPPNTLSVFGGIRNMRVRSEDSARDKRAHSPTVREG